MNKFQADMVFGDTLISNIECSINIDYLYNGYNHRNVQHWCQKNVQYSAVSVFRAAF